MADLYSKHLIQTKEPIPPKMAYSKNHFINILEDELYRDQGTWMSTCPTVLAKQGQFTVSSYHLEIEVGQHT